MPSRGAAGSPVAPLSPVADTARGGLDPRQLRAALAVARRRSFSLAAKDLFLAQSSVSRQIDGLERRLGTPLFRRSPAGVRLTPAAILFLPKAQAVLDALAAAEAFVRPVPPQRQPRPTQRPGPRTEALRPTLPPLCSP